MEAQKIKNPSERIVIDNISASVLPGEELGSMMKSPESGSFSRMLARHNIELQRCKATVLQINTGRLCNQRCRHCHLSAGPESREIMSRETADQLIAFAGRYPFESIDITGGAPELNPHLDMMIQKLRPLTQSLTLRCNLSVLGRPEKRGLLELLRDEKVDIIASFPALSESQLEAQRGKGMFECSIKTLQLLNRMGWGVPESQLDPLSFPSPSFSASASTSDLTSALDSDAMSDSPLLLNLVSNPSGAFLPPSQEALEKQFRRILEKKWGIFFNQLFTFANVPLGRFREWLIESGNYESYLEKLTSAFNPCALDGVMCRNLVSVNWEGYLYDCDFNLAAGLPMGGRKTHILKFEKAPEPGIPIAVADHCFTCTAGAGFT